MKKAVSFVLLFVLLLSLSVTAFAVDEVTGYVGNSNNVTYRYNASSKTLTISGNGKMSAQDVKRMDPFQLADYGPFYKVYAWCSEVETVVIEEGVRDLPSSTFCGFDSLKILTIPKSVTDIGEFWDSPCLEDIYYRGTITLWNKIYFEYYPLRQIIVRNHDPEYPRAINSLYPKTHIMGSKTGWTTEFNKTYYLTEEHVVYYGKQTVNGKRYIFEPVTGELLKGRVTCGGVNYIASKKDGHLLYGKVRCDNRYYIMKKTDGRMLYGRVQCDGKLYITSPKTGEIQYGKVNFDGKVYIAGKKDGRLYPNARVRCDGIYYRTDETGAVI